jgi:hypothetical protein
LTEPKTGQTSSDLVDSKTVVLTIERYIILKKLVKNSTNWLFDPNLNNPTVKLNEKPLKKNISMLLETFMYKKQE